MAFSKICDFFSGNFKFNFKFPAFFSNLISNFPKKIVTKPGFFRFSKIVSGARFVSRIWPTWGSGTLFSTILGPLAMYWKCFQRFLESLTFALIFNLDFAENFVSSNLILYYYPGQLENPALVGMCAPTETGLRRDKCYVIYRV